MLARIVAPAAVLAASYCGALLAGTFDSRLVVLPAPLGLMQPDVPADDPPTNAKIALGERIFFDTSLSKNGAVSCATCHRPDHGFSDDRSHSIDGEGRLTRRKTPTLLNVGFETSLMWDGRFKSLEQQALDPFSAGGDMGIDVGEAMERIAANRSYVGMFEHAFGTQPTTDGARKALASYERTLVTGDSRFDEYLYGGVVNALTSSEKRGYELFIGDGNCIRCHDVFDQSVNPLGGRYAPFTDHRYHNLGVGYDRGVINDLGRYAVSLDPDDWGAFKTPDIRDVARRGPYMHDGSLKTLEDVVNFYNRGGIPNPNVATALGPLGLSAQDKADLVAFLRALNGQRSKL